MKYFMAEVHVSNKGYKSLGDNADDLICRDLAHKIIDDIPIEYLKRVFVFGKPIKVDALTHSRMCKLPITTHEKEKKKLANGGVLRMPTIAILSDEQQRGNYTGYSVSSKKLIELIESQNKEEITVQGNITGHDLVIKPKEP